MSNIKANQFEFIPSCGDAQGQTLKCNEGKHQCSSYQGQDKGTLVTVPWTNDEVEEDLVGAILGDKVLS